MVRRSISKPSELAAYYLCRSHTPATLAEVVRVAGSRWGVEETFQYRHITLFRLAAAFLAITDYTEHLRDKHHEVRLPY